ncbi:C-type lectin domain family 2 member D-like isoform X3 [Zootoca vivipara]|nr:C-type lectin domain family 2 member D-like isoform X3 [Zootoca vivipara]
MAVQDDHDQESPWISNGPTTERQRTACLSWKNMFIAIIIIIILIIIVIPSIVFGTRTGKAPEQPVPPCKVHACASGWKAYEQKCYYFSDVEKNWTLSQSFCASQNASLAVLEREDEMRVVMGLKGKYPFWIGVRREPGQRWKWLHGNSSALDVSGYGGNCACLNDEPTPSSLRCSTEHHFICTKTMKEAGAVPGVKRVE